MINIVVHLYFLQEHLKVMFFCIYKLSYVFHTSVVYFGAFAANVCVCVYAI